MIDPNASLNDIQNQSAANVRALDETVVEKPRPKTIWVTPADLTQPIRRNDGSLITGPTEVDAGDVFIARRIRDRSLVTTEPVAPPAPAPQPQAKPLNMGADARVDARAGNAASETRTQK